MFDILRDTRWANSACAPIAGDASARRYFRIGPPDAILMDDPTHSTQRFADVANALLAIGLSAPEIHVHNPDSGTMIIADLGQNRICKTSNASSIRRRRTIQGGNRRPIANHPTETCA